MNLNIGYQINVTIKIADGMGYLVNINDYNIEGFISLSDAHRKRNSTRFAVGTQHVAKIIRMNNNNNNNYIDLAIVNRL